MQSDFTLFQEPGLGAEELWESLMQGRKDPHWSVRRGPLVRAGAEWRGTEILLLQTCWNTMKVKSKEQSSVQKYLGAAVLGSVFEESVIKLIKRNRQSLSYM